MKTKFLGFRRENGRVGVRNHVIILPLDDLSNAACEAVANNVKGTLALPHPYGRLQFGKDLDLHFSTLIGTGSNPNVAAVVVIGIEPVWTARVVDGIAKTGKPVAGFSIEQNGDLSTICAASRKAKEFVHMAGEIQRQECDIKDLWVSTKCGESDTTSGIASNPTVGNAFDKLYAKGCTLLFGETTEVTGGEHLVAARCRTPEIRAKFQFMFGPLRSPGGTAQDRRPLRLQPTKGQHRGRPDHHRGKGPGQHPEDRQEMRGGRRPGQGRSPHRPRTDWFMDSSSGCRRDGHPVRRFRLRRATCSPPDRATSSATPSCR